MINDNFHMREGKVEFRWKRWRNKKRQEVSSCLMVLFSGAVLLGGGGVALAGPTGGQVTGGQGTITTPDGTTTNINQQSNVLNINWQDFSIQQGETVNFYQPGSTSVAINRVVGGVPSYLAGALNANGRVFILNSAGITFTGTSQVNVGALLATTAMTVNGDPTKAASYSGSGYGAVINQGSISVSNGGFAILAAPYVQNTGFIKADLGTIALAGTNQFTLDLSGTGLINFVVPAGAVEKIVSDGKAVGVDNAGTLQARSGQVLISANVASEVINAVVNLNGIVDADAFAPNGQGGAVLVSAAGDINVGGQVTARGDGTGAGGQVVTKAVETDNIEQMAFISATGGANGGLGGNIEVSGKTVGLNGAIDPGKGGLLYIDPLQFTIRNATSGQSASGIGEHKLEALLQNGAGFLVNAAGNITIQDLSDNVLAGGRGDLTLHAGTGGVGNIIVKGVSDVIRTGSGDITLTAAGNIGDTSHRLSFVSGTGLPGVSQAGDIVLKATNGGSIFVKNVTEKSAGAGVHHVLFSANAANAFSAAGFIDVEAVASGHNADASAEANLLAKGHLTVKGAITVQAHANGASGSDHANATLVAAQAHSVIGNNVITNAASSIFVGGAINIAAVAVDDDSGAAVKSAARTMALFAGKQILAGGVTRVKATASGDNAHPGNGVASGNILACATLIAGDGTLNIAHGYWRTHLHANHVHFENAVDVEAHAAGDSTLINSIKAHASAEFYGVDVAVDGEATVKATTEGSGARNDIAATRLIVAGSANSQNYGSLLRDFHGSYFAFGEGIDVEAHAHGNAIGHAADALAFAGFAGNDVIINGNVTMLADATGHGRPSDPASTVWADVHFAIGTEIRRNDTAAGFYGSSGVPRNFARSVHIGGGITLEAVDSGSYLQGQGVYGNATGDIRGARAKPFEITVNGPVTVQTQTWGSHVHTASADARIIFRVGSGKLTVPDHILIDAEASGHDANLTCAEARVHVYSSGVHPNATFISSDGITVIANAAGSGGPGFGCNEVFATASISAQANHMTIRPGADDGILSVLAEANGINVNNIIASAGGFFKSWNNAGTADVNVPLSVTALAHGTGRGSNVGEILAVAYVTMHDQFIDFAPTPSGSLDPGGPAIVDLASASGHDAALIKADAHGLLGETFGNHLAIDGAVILQANAHGDSAGSIVAVALAPEQAKGAEIQSLTILATASGSQVARNVLASAALFARDGNQGIAFSEGSLDIEARANGIQVGGSVCAHAEASFSDAGPLLINGATKILATASGNDVGNVHAIADLLADTAYNTAVSETFQGSIDVEAHGNVGAGGANSAAADASVNLAALGGITINAVGSLASAMKVLASADPLDHAGVAIADASLNVDAAGNLFIRGNVTAQAIALGDGVFSPARHDIADALQHLEGASVTIAGNLRSLALADGSQAQAAATIELQADGHPGDIHLVETDDPLAQASAGAVHTFRRAHTDTSSQVIGPLDSSALVDIDINLTGTLTLSP